MSEDTFDAKRLGALAHPIRLHILEATELELVSPSDVAVELGEPLGVVAYHFRVLHTAGLIELVGTDRRRGGIQSFYRATRSGWGEVGSALRALVREDAPTTRS
jgi:DNA-binding transcriptional ArsR family regulator